MEFELSVVRALTETPFSISNSTVFKFPPSDAQCNGVELSVVRALTETPFSISNSTVFKFPPIQMLNVTESH
jgi:hypothetical protein